MKQPSPARVWALKILIELERGRARVNDLLFRRLEKLEPVDRALATHLVMGVLRLRGQLDWLWQAHSKRSPTQVDPVVVNILRLGGYQHFFCTKIAPYAVVNESVLLARSFRQTYASGFVNAVLRSLTKQTVWNVPHPQPHDSLPRLAKLLSHPAWLLTRWIDRFGFSETIKLCSFNNREPDHFVRVNTSEITLEKLLSHFSSKAWNPQPVAGLHEAIRMTAHGNITNDAGYGKGWYDVQSLSSMLVSRIVNPKPGEIVLDACAGRGGKATHMAQLMEGKGMILAGDIRPAKLSLLQENKRRLKVEIIQPMGYNGTKAVFRRKFDRILLDAPCSSLGVVGRYPDIKWSKKEKDLTNSSQRSLLSHLAQWVKPGGVIVYVVCSFEPEETENIIGDFLSRHNKFVRENIRDYLPEPFQESITSQGFWFPQHCGMEGFFCARLRKLR